MFDAVRIKAQAFHLGARSAIVLCTDGVVQQKFRSALRRVDLDREHRRRSD